MWDKKKLFFGSFPLKWNFLVSSEWQTIGEWRESLMSNPKYHSLPRVITDSDSNSQEEVEGTMANVVSTIPSTLSSQHLMSPDAESVITEEDRKSLRRRNSEVEQTFGSVTSSQWFTVAVLCFINLINYMDRFTIAGKSLTQT